MAIVVRPSASLASARDDADLGERRRPTTSPRRARARRGRRRRPAAARRAGARPPTAARRARRPASSSPSGSAVDPVADVERVDEQLDVASADVPGRAKPMLAAIVSSNRNGSWDTTTSRCRSSSLATFVSGTPPSRIWPTSGRRSGRSGGRASSCPNRWRRPSPPADRPGCAPRRGRARRRRSSPRSAARPVRERDVVDVDVERPAGQRPGMVGRRRADRDVEHAEHATQPGDRGLGLVEHLGELGDRLEEPVRQEDEADQRTGGEPAGRADVDADHDDRGDGEHREHLARAGTGTRRSRWPGSERRHELLTAASVRTAEAARRRRRRGSSRRR